MLLPNAKIKELKSDSKTEQLIKTIVSQQKKQDESIKKALDSINKSLEVVKKISARLSSASQDGVKNEDKIIEVQKTMEQLLQNSIDSIKAINNKKTDLTELVSSINGLADKIDQTEVVTSLDNINKNLQSKNKEWTFSVIRDQFDRIDRIKAISK
jgi:ABC-type transporter Mla subunit MlaD